MDVGYLTLFELREATTVSQQTRDRAHMIRLYDDCSLTPRQRYSLDTSFRKRGGHVNCSILLRKAFLFEQRL
ncbi:hypothetical protein [Coleofasciculus sp. FACHB-SPT36]|uniref:hypothetical protein n=1 Tax=Cyanophyceae TaxID=3028117 RepID=UPI00168B8908|nr:hypothetical protein [Coleofasciculus sp. FACHB-SPT36]MBD2538166.1 hypothetical protein [Coleofasciculus sp. FACHB-SPT36]